MSTSDPALPGQLAERLQRQMVSGELQPGAKLPSQRVMVERYQLSRSTVREAVGLLQNAGLVETRHGGGSFCINLLESAFNDDGEQSSVPGLTIQQQVLEVREVLEGEAAYFCALRASDSQLHSLAREYQRMRQPGKGANTLRQAKADLSFHMRIAEQSHHLLVMSLSQILYTRYFNAIYGVLSLTFKKRGRLPDRIGVQHQQIYQAIMARDAGQARLLAREHIAYTRGLLAS